MDFVRAGNARNKFIISVSRGPCEGGGARGSHEIIGVGISPSFLAFLALADFPKILSLCLRLMALLTSLFLQIQITDSCVCQEKKIPSELQTECSRQLHESTSKEVSERSEAPLAPPRFSKSASFP